MWSFSENIWPNAQRNWPNASAFDELCTHLVTVGRINQMRSAIGQTRSAIGQMRAHLTNFVRILSLLVGLTKCAQRDCPNARTFGQTRARFTKRCAIGQMLRVWPIGQMRCAIAQMRRLVKCALQCHFQYWYSVSGIGIDRPLVLSIIAIYHIILTLAYTGYTFCWSKASSIDIMTAICKATSS